MKILAAIVVVLGLAAEPVFAEPLHFTKLIEQLPGEDAFDEFKRQKPEGTTTNSMGFHTTVVSVEFLHVDDSAKSITFQYTDGAPTQFVTMAYSALAQFSKESTEGYEKGVKLGDFQAIEKFRNEPQDGSLTAVVGEVLVQIDTEGLPAETLRTAWGKVPTAGIVEAKKNQ
mgnify:CR=1 FL=1